MTWNSLQAQRADLSASVISMVLVLRNRLSENISGQELLAGYSFDCMDEEFEALVTKASNRTKRFTVLLSKVRYCYTTSY